MSEHNVNIPHGELQTQSLAGAEPQHEEQEASLLTINGTLPLIAVSFVLFAIVMQKIFYGPLNKIRQNRQDYIKGIKSEAQQAFEQSRTLQAEYEEKIKKARKKVSEKTNFALNEANQEKARILEEKRQDAAGFLEEKRQKIRQESDETLESLKGSIAEYAGEIAKKVLEEDVPVIVVSKEAIDDAVKNS